MSAVYPLCQSAAPAQLAAQRFRTPTVADAPLLSSTFSEVPSRACDFTVGGVLLWVDYFGYRLSPDGAGGVVIRGASTDRAVTDAFWPAAHGMEPQLALEMFRSMGGTDHPVLTAVPDELLDAYASLPGARVEEMPDFADYIYPAEQLATFSGKKLGRKRNHVNRFAAEHPEHWLEPLTEANLADVRDFYLRTQHKDNSASAQYENRMVGRLLSHYADYPFTGAALRTPDRGVVAFTIAEVRGDTLHVHIEKMDHTIDGSGETVCQLFVRQMLAEHPGLLWINRQDDAGDPGLRQAKLAYVPSSRLRKYNIRY